MALGAFAATPKYVFLFIGDGMSTPQRMIAEEFSRKVGNGSLAMNTLPYQATTRTCSANSLVTDSAAAATAIACGVKTYNHAIGVDAKAKPAESCAEVAKKAGKKVGIVFGEREKISKTGNVYIVTDAKEIITVEDARAGKYKIPARKKAATVSATSSFALIGEEDDDIPF